MEGKDAEPDDTVLIMDLDDFCYPKSAQIDEVNYEDIPADVLIKINAAHVTSRVWYFTT